MEYTVRLFYPVFVEGSVIKVCLQNSIADLEALGSEPGPGTSLSVTYQIYIAWKIIIHVYRIHKSFEIVGSFLHNEDGIYLNW